jgi:CDP-diacylglycerol--glycerol-3-phosphate 3-phosphatidyltransferase
MESMASIYDLKPRFQALLRPVMRGLAGAGATPNTVTVAAMVLSAAVGGLIAWQPAARWPLLALPATLFVRMALNALDGMMARELDMASRLGAILNEVGDVVADAALYLPLALVPGISPILLVPAVVLAVVTEMMGVVSVQVGASRRYDGPMGKSDRAFVFGAMALALGLGAPAGRWVDVVLGAMLVLLVLTIFNRARRALAEHAP